MGRRHKLTKKVQARLVQAIRLGTTVADACACAGISPATYHRWEREGIAEIEANGKPTTKFGKFAEAIEGARGESRERMLAVIEKAALEGDWRAAVWKLRLAGYGNEPQHVVLTGADGGAVRHAVAPDAEAMKALVSDPEALGAIRVLSDRSAALALTDDQADSDGDG